jgi:LacI family transcriptional regulator
VLAVARRNAYTPNAAARTLITSRTLTVGVVVSDITNPFYPQLINVLGDELALAGYRLVLFNDRSGQANEEIPRQLQGNAVDGVILTSAMLDSELARRCRASGFPLVLLNRDVPDIDVDRVVSDNVSGGRIAATTLLAGGHRTIATISGPSNTSTGRDRLRGFREVLAQHPGALGERVRHAAAYSHDSGYRASLELLALEPRPTAIFAANDVLALGALDAARRLGVRVPHDCSIIGYDDIEMASWEVFSLTTIRQPIARMAEAAARLLVERIEGVADRPGRRRVFDAELVVRATIAPPPA